MTGEPTHASFFSGVGGLDLGLERAGWRTVSFSEIDPYACAVLAERWPDTPNLGSIVDLIEQEPARGVPRPFADATLWSGGFPCQDLSVAGKRAGFAGARSGLAFAFLDLVGRYRPRAVLLENVPGLLSSHAGRDFGTLLDTLGQLGYGWAYRVLDAQHFGVPQRRRRVFILALDSGRGPGAERAAEVLSVGSRCDRHPPTGVEAGPRVTAGAANGPGVAFSVRPRSGMPQGWNANLIGSSPDPGGVRAPDGLAGRLDDRTVAATLNSGGNNGGFRTEPGAHLVYRKATKAHSADDWERWERAERIDTLDAEGLGALQATAVMGEPAAAGADDLLPLGLDSHRYRCCGNGVVSSVAEWIGLRLLAAIERAA